MLGADLSLTSLLHLAMVTIRMYEMIQHVGCCEFQANRSRFGNRESQILLQEELALWLD